MRFSVWKTIAYAKNRKDCLLGWRVIFGTEFGTIQRFLVVCPGEIALTYPDPCGSGTLQLTRFENRWVAYPAARSGDQSEDIELVEAEVQLYRLDVDSLREHLRRSLSIDGPSSPVQPGLECLGSCTQGPKRRRVYWVQSHDESSAIVGAQEVIRRSGPGGCAILTSIGEATDRMLTTAGVSGVDLENRVKLQLGRVECGCGIVCRHLSVPARIVPQSGEQNPADHGETSQTINTLGKLQFLPGFDDVWFHGTHYDLRGRIKAKLCLQFLLASKAFDADSAVHFLNEIDPYVREHGNFPPAREIKLDHYFKDSKGKLNELRRHSIHSVKRSGRYYLKVE